MARSVSIRLLSLLVTVAALLLVLSSNTCTSSESHIGKTKSFLSECSADAPCADPAQACFCFCTVACDSADPCLLELERLGLSVDPTRIKCRPPSCEAAGGDEQPADASGVCDITCAGDGDCTIFSDEHRCLGGFCRLEAAPSGPGAGACPADMTFVPGDGGETTADFCLDRYEVTVFAYAACVEDGTCAAPAVGNFYEEASDDHPIENVAPEDAEAYCAFAGRRLPGRAEWQWAAQNGPAMDEFPWGAEPPSASDAPPRVCALPPYQSETCAIGSRPAGDNALGIADLSGNVAELVFADPDYCAAGGGYTALTAEELSPTTCPNFDVTAGYIGFRCALTP